MFSNHTNNINFKFEILKMSSKGKGKAVTCKTITLEGTRCTRTKLFEGYCYQHRVAPQSDQHRVAPEGDQHRVAPEGDQHRVVHKQVDKDDQRVDNEIFGTYKINPGMYVINCITNVITAELYNSKIQPLMIEYAGDKSFGGFIEYSDWEDVKHKIYFIPEFPRSGKMKEYRGWFRPHYTFKFENSREACGMFSVIPIEVIDKEIKLNNVVHFDTEVTAVVYKDGKTLFVKNYHEYPDEEDHLDQLCECIPQPPFIEDDIIVKLYSISPPEFVAKLSSFKKRKLSVKPYTTMSDAFRKVFGGKMVKARDMEVKDGVYCQKDKKPVARLG